MELIFPGIKKEQDLWDGPVREELTGRADLIEKIVDCLGHSDNDSISLNYAGANGGHAVAIKKIKGSTDEVATYVFFDPNLGEINLKGEKALKNYIKEWYLAMTVLLKETDSDASALIVHTDLAKYRSLLANDEKSLNKIKNLLEHQYNDIDAYGKIIDRISTDIGLIKVKELFENHSNALSGDLKKSIVDLLNLKKQEISAHSDTKYWSTCSLKQENQEFLIGDRCGNLDPDFKEQCVSCNQQVFDLMDKLDKLKNDVSIYKGDMSEKQRVVLDSAMDKCHQIIYGFKENISLGARQD